MKVRHPIPRSGKPIRKAAMPWNMCRTCHREGTPRRWSLLKCPAHPLLPIGECGQCGKRRPLVNCHAYDFRKPIPKVNARRQAKRKAGYRKLLSGKEYKAARAEAMQRAGNQCEFLCFGADHFASWMARCAATEDLHAHHLRYPKSRPLEARDLLIVCKPHHEYLESLKMGKTRMY